MKYRVGFGYDVHPFETGRKLILGGIEIPYESGLKGHSDADVLLHSITDAILGAAALGDIGTHFPDNDPNFEGADSMLLIEEAVGLVKEKGFEIGNVDATIIVEAPKMNPYIPKMQKKISVALGCDEMDISIKATTHEKMGSLGRNEGIAVHSIVLIGRL